MKVFRDYQLAAAAAILKSWQTHRTCIATVATGGGKTLIAAGLSKTLVPKGRVLFLANRNELCQQPIGAFRDQLGVIPALEKAEFKAPLTSNVVIGSVQTLTRKARLERFPKDHFDFIFCDEAHGATAESWKRILNHFDSAKVAGITATPFRADGKKLADVFEEEAFRKDLFDLVDEGYLVSPDHVERLSTPISLANVRVRRSVDGKDFDVNDSADAILPHFKAIAQELKARFDNRHILCFLPLVASSIKFVEACKAEGINAIHIDGADPERDQKLEAFRQGRITLLSNANLLHTGIDLPICDATLNLRPTKSKVLYTQVIGRSTRTEPGVIDNCPDAASRLAAIANSRKPDSIIIDPLWLTLEHDLVAPAYLIAGTEELAEEMAQKAPGSYSLRELSRDIQAEREAVILRRLQNAERFRQGIITAEYFAAAIQDHDLVNYQPAYAWETARVRPETRRILASCGIDPESTSSEGYARQVIRRIYIRRYRKLAEIRDLAGLDGGNIWTLTAAEVRARRRAA